MMLRYRTPLLVLFAAPLAAQQHARVRGSVLVQGWRPDGAGNASRDLVIAR
jgi:hypothetical protein